jgi:hypothetical protein
VPLTIKITCVTRCHFPQLLLLSDLLLWTKGMQTSPCSLLPFLGGCTFDDGPGACDYHQDLYDDFEWVHVSAQEPHYLPPEMPQGKSHSPNSMSREYFRKKKKKNKQDFFTLHVTIEICYIKLIKWSIWSHVKNFKIFFTIFYTFLYSSKFLNTTFCALQKLCKFINISCFCLLIRSQNDQVKLILII